MAPAENAAARWGRRAVTIPLLLALGAATLALLPLLLFGAFAVDLVRGGGLARVRLVAFAPVYLLAELLGLAGSFAVWLAFGPWRRGDPARFLALNFRLQGVWARALLAAVRRVFGLRFVVQGDEQIAPGPLLVFARHASIADVLLPAVLVAARHRLRLRWVLKRELLVDPCLDVVGCRLPNVFVDRSAVRSEREIAEVARLAEGLGPGDGVLIYPEGTRFTPAKQQRAFERIGAGERPGRLARLRGLRRLLPPRSGGPLALLAAAPRADVLLLGHAGLDGLAELRDLLSGSLVGRTVAVRFWRHAAAAVPREPEQALAWLDARWCELDGWVDERLTAAEVAPLSVAGVLLLNLGVALAAMGLLWLASLARRDASIVDAWWGPGFALLAWVDVAATGAHPRSLLLAAAATLWGLRLGGYLLWRNHGQPEDPRYAAMRRHHGAAFPLVSLLTVFALQGVLQVAVGLPIAVVAAEPGSARLGALDALGAALFAAGLAFESVGDLQLARFKADPESAGRVMDRGLWAWTRHPNYFGDCLAWWGIFVVALAAPSGWASLPGPALMTFLLLRVSGVALLERSIGKRRPGYAAYAARVPAFFPRPPRRVP